MRLKLKRQNARCLLAGAVISLIGLCGAFLPLGDSLVNFSYDLPMLFRSAPAEELLLIYMDDRAYRERNQERGKPWSRAEHADLLGRLTLDGARLVVFDVIFDQKGTPDANEALASAMRAHGKVVIAGDERPLTLTGLNAGTTLFLANDLFRTNSAGWGLARATQPTSERIPVCRKHYPGTEMWPSLPWVAAEQAEAAITRAERADRRGERWLNYYRGIPQISYADYELMTNGFFRDRYVFVGNRPTTEDKPMEQDAFATPITRWTHRAPVPGLEIHAATFLNLMREDWLTRWRWMDGVLVVLGGFGAAFGFSHVRPRRALGLAVVVGVMVGVMGAAVPLLFGGWVAWMVIVGVQVPCALLYGFAEQSQIEHYIPDPESAATNLALLAAPGAPGSGEPSIPDYSLIRSVGAGAYGQVWLARNAIGMFHAAKIIFRYRFANSQPYERAFRGIEKYMPISRSHPGYLQILHVGRNDAAGYFYYIMEAGDGAGTGKKIDADTYSPRTLESELASRGALPVGEALQLVVTLAGVLEHLHQQQLIHRDIKPSNILYVDGSPKLADIDLVTDLSASREVSRLGTEGYMAPEGPGSPSADVYSLGKVLYVASTGKHPNHFPELPTTLSDRDDSSALLLLNQIMCKACESSVERRYPTAVALSGDLLRLQAQLRV